MYRFLVALLDASIVIITFIFFPYFHYYYFFLLQSYVCFKDKATLVDGYLALELVNKDGFW